MVSPPQSLSPQTLVAAIRAALVSSMAEVKAYEVPSLCERYGLATGSEDEAFKSKAAYISKRLQAVPAQRLMEIGREHAAERVRFPLSEALAHFDERDQPQITELTRKRIINFLKQDPLLSEGGELQFFERLWPIEQMRCAIDLDGWRSFKDGFVRHTLANDDWDREDVLRALDLPHLSIRELGRFFEALVHPLAQNEERQAELVHGLNYHLRFDGYELSETTKISGSPVFEMRRLPAGAPSDAAISATLKAFDPNDVHPRWEEARDQRSARPGRAITLARTLLEDVCKWIIDEAGETYEEKDDLPALYRKLAKILKLAPDDHTEQVFKQILGSCQQIVEGLGSLRNKLGDAHSTGPRRAKPQPRHAELAVNLAGSMATFLVSTWEVRKAEVAEAQRRVL